MKITHGIKQNSKGFYVFDTRYKAEKVYSKTIKDAKTRYYGYLKVAGWTQDNIETHIKENYDKI